jgi:hypothetical protein
MVGTRHYTGAGAKNADLELVPSRSTVCVLLGSGAGVDSPMNTTSSDGVASSPLLLVVRDLRLSTVLQRHLF